VACAPIQYFLYLIKRWINYWYGLLSCFTHDLKLRTAFQSDYCVTTSFQPCMLVKNKYSRYITTLFILGQLRLHVVLYGSSFDRSACSDISSKTKYPSLGYWKWSIIYSCMWKLDRTILVEVSLTKIGSPHFGIYIVTCLLHTAIFELKRYYS
jgi:hypothetical protein